MDRGGQYTEDSSAEKYSVQYYNDGHMSLYICQNPQNVQHQCIVDEDEGMFYLPYRGSNNSLVLGRPLTYSNSASALDAMFLSIFHSSQMY